MHIITLKSGYSIQLSENCGDFDLYRIEVISPRGEISTQRYALLLETAYEVIEELTPLYS